MLKLPLVRNAFPAVASAALYALAFPPANLFLLAYLALVPWLCSLATMTPRQAIRSGLFFGWMFWMFQMAWLQVLVGRWTGSWFVGAVPWLLASLVAMWYFGLLGWLIQRAFASRQPWMIPVVWAGVEVIRSYFPALAFPWGLLATPLWVAPVLIQSAKIWTIFGVSFLAAAVNWLVASLMMGVGLRGVAPAGKKDNQQAYLQVRGVLMSLLIVAAIVLLSAQPYSGPVVGTKLPVTIGQPGVDLAFGDPDSRPNRIRESCDALLAVSTYNGSRFLVLPEGMTDGGPTIPPVTPFAMMPGAPVVFGGRRTVGDRAFQSAFSYDGEWSVSDKTRLVIFGEFVPLRNVLPFLSAFNLQPYDLQAGDRVSSLSVAGTRVGPLLCFEALFPDLAWKQVDNGAQVLAVMSIDDWYAGTNAPDQLMAGSVWRAVESGLPLVRSASLGYSLAVDSRGNVLARARFGAREALRVELTVPASPETYASRKVAPWLFVLGVVWVVAFPWVRQVPRSTG